MQEPGNGRANITTQEPANLTTPGGSRTLAPWGIPTARGRVPMNQPMKRPWKKRLARLTAVVLLLLFCLLLLEVGTRVVTNANGMNFAVEMWKYARDVKRPSASAALGHEHTPHARAFLMGAQVEINALGLRDREIEVAKPAGTYRVLILGDSVTFGWGVAQEQVFPEVLERLWNELPPAGFSSVEVINAGVGNYNTSQEVAYFAERGLALAPDLVILAFFLNDAEPTPRPAAGWLARNSAFYVLLTSSWDNTMRWAGNRQDYRDYYQGLYEDDRPGWIECRRALRELGELCRKQRIDLRFAILPELHRLGADYPFRSVHAKVRSMAAEIGVPVYDLLNAPWSEPPEAYWVTPGDAHPNEKGHRVIAEALAAALRNEK